MVDGAISQGYNRRFDTRAVRAHRDLGVGGYAMGKPLGLLPKGSINHLTSMLGMNIVDVKPKSYR